RRDDERLDVEAADELPVAAAVGVGLDVALIPRHAEGPVRDLDDEEVEIGVRRQPADVDVHSFDRTFGLDPDMPDRAGQTTGRGWQHVEVNIAVCFCCEPRNRPY